MQDINFFLKLRSNIILDGDIDLAEKEIKLLFKQVERVYEPIAVEEKLNLSSERVSFQSRKTGCIGFIAYGTVQKILDFVFYLNFIQEIWFEKVYADKAEECFEGKPWIIKVTDGDTDFFCALPVMACSELLSKSRVSSQQEIDIGILISYLARNGSKKSIKVSTSRNSSTHHVHALHKYKAKFFPRLIRSFLVRYLKGLPVNGENKVTLLDPFVGSGTALIEATLLGIDSVGIDIDKLSCAISRAKIDALTISPKRVTEAVNTLNSSIVKKNIEQPYYHFPQKIAKKFERGDALEEQLEYEKTITKWKSEIEQIANPEIRNLFKVCLSDALTRKFVIRMMGTGVGRFALEVAKTSLDSLMNSNLKSLIHNSFVVNRLIDGYDLTLGKAQVHHGNAMNIPFEKDSFSIIITSPPYLPASSGRENYLIGKAISITALNIMTNEEIEETETFSIGSMKSVIDQKDGLPQAVYELYKWLFQDSLRNIKAKPTLAYYVSLKQALEESFRVLLPKGIAIYVIGKESVFYNFKTREILYKVQCDKIFAEIAKSCGFTIEEQINVELDKKNRNARPRSLDSYYEAVFILRKNI